MLFADDPAASDHTVVIIAAGASALTGLLSAVFAGITSMRKSASENKIAEVKAQAEVNDERINTLETQHAACVEAHEACERKTTAMQAQLDSQDAEITKLKKTVNGHV
jgi:hypothetical protein